jgi:hypothetical protein
MPAKTGCEQHAVKPGYKNELQGYCTIHFFLPLRAGMQDAARTASHSPSHTQRLHASACAACCEVCHPDIH